jgi:hypothetical protein
VDGDIGHDSDFQEVIKNGGLFANTLYFMGELCSFP